ncbi:hypothetical protein AB3S75_027462 [Citrus x aurantiifolia]
MDMFWPAINWQQFQWNRAIYSHYPHQHVQKRQRRDLENYNIGRGSPASAKSSTRAKSITSANGGSAESTKANMNVKAANNTKGSPASAKSSTRAKSITSANGGSAESTKANMNVKAANNAKAITKAKAANKAKPIVTYNVNYIFQYNAYNVNSPCTNVIAINNKAYPQQAYQYLK